MKKMIEKFQCPGCACGGNTNCGVFKLSVALNSCENHILGTSILGVGNIAIGLPKGFNRSGWDFSRDRTHNQMYIRFWAKESQPGWDRYNVPVWYLEQDGFLFVRTFAPRTNRVWTDVIEGGVAALIPIPATDVSEFIDEID